MRFSKPAWVTHQDQIDQQRVPLYSCHVHPDGTRLATGGRDAKIRIWSTLPILSARAEKTGVPKELCTLKAHTGPVSCVRWNSSGKWLATGSHDTTIVIWFMHQNDRGRAWGDDEATIEEWDVLKSLPSYSGVTDLAWSPRDRFLASVGLNKKVTIWCGHKFETLRKLDMHQGFVKGVCWDPVGEFMATQSDDKSVKVWRTSDWECEATITKPFQDSPGNPFFRRLSWSPDGAHITASNAMNNNGYVIVAAVIARNGWTSDICLVGHGNTVKVAAFNPRIFLRDPTPLSIESTNICSVVALGADDLSVSIWQTKFPRPLIVARDAFENQILDLSWSMTGLTLYACSADGSLGVFDFDPDELGGVVSLEEKEYYLKRFGFQPSAEMREGPASASFKAYSDDITSLPNDSKVPPAQQWAVASDDRGERQVKPLSISSINVPFTGPATPVSTPTMSLIHNGIQGINRLHPHQGRGDYHNHQQRFIRPTLTSDVSETLEQILRSLTGYRIEFGRIAIRENVDELGFGGYGTVRLADLHDWDEHPTIPVAVKVLRTPSVSRRLRATTAIRLARELKIWAGLIHPNILRLIGFCLSEDLDEAWLVSPYEASGNLTEYLTRENPDQPRRLEIIIDTAKGLLYLHSRNPIIVHGDLKPANVVISQDGRAKLCDFGLAKALDDPTGLTSTTSIRGSPRYMGPELLEDDAILSTGSDVWAWACIAGEVITGLLPYHTEQSQLRLIMRIGRYDAPISFDGFQLPDVVKTCIV